ncbi:MAG TPA: NYN domain-containing protein [Sphingomonas sp.]|jgi:hypothetical protein|uniref:NYN domain-containing protein n=1 Tax=Sphingomonas sp. TaxID=28214 RepID=UPI002ED93A2D
MATEHDRPHRLAVLIDADNASPRIAPGLFKEIAAIGEASVRRIYGDFSGTRLKGWSEVLSTHAIMPHQNFSNTVGKNASDIALVIDAMDLLHTGRFDAFCLVSSDSDFTRLAARIREQGVDVYGFGEAKTPASFRQACRRFIYTENLVSAAEPDTLTSTDVETVPVACPASLKQPPTAAVPLIETALSQMEDQNGWYFLGAVGNRLPVLMPDFDPRTYGCAKLVTLIERSEAFEVRRENLTVHIKPRAMREAHQVVDPNVMNGRV